MDKDFNQEIEEHAGQNYSMRLRDGSFPPRSTVHGLREENKSKKVPYAIIASSVIFLLIIGSFLYFQFPFAGAADNNNNQAQPAQGDQIDNNGTNNQDNIVDSDNENTPSGDLNQNNQESEDSENTPPQDDSTGSDFNRDIVHVVKKGESLYSISMDYYSNGSYYDDLARYNNLDNPDNIKVGTEIRIPDVSLLSQK